MEKLVPRRSEKLAKVPGMTGGSLASSAGMVATMASSTIGGSRTMQVADGADGSAALRTAALLPKTTLRIFEAVKAAVIRPIV